MIRYRGNVLRAPTLHLRGEYHVSNACCSGAFKMREWFMTQRISVRIRLIQTDKTLLIRRADGRESILGKYELPGGRIKPGEQPEDAARRFLLDQLGIKDVTLRLNDAMTYQDDDLNAQYAIIVYLVPVGKGKRIISLGEHYDKYVWYSPGKVDQSMMTDVSRLVLGAMTALPLEGEAELESGSKDGAFVYTDGGSRGNPGPSAAGYVIIKEGEIVDQGGEYIGITTNNQAEYHGVKLGLEAALRLGIPEVEVRVDSMLVANQLNGVYTIKNRELWPINERVQGLIRQFKRAKFTFVPRELNQLADGMVNRTLNTQEQYDIMNDVDH